MEDKKVKIDETSRVDKGFKSWIEEIQKERLRRLIDTKKISSRKITSMIPKHKFSQRIKEDIINFKFDE